MLCLLPPPAMPPALLEIFAFSLLLGAFSGLSAGLFGLGGGVIIVPVLSTLLAAYRFNPDQVMLLAVATSLATALPTSSSSVLTHHRLGNIVWSKAWRLAPSLLVGAIGGAALAKDISPAWLRGCFIAYLLYTSLRLMRSNPNKPVPKLHGEYLDFPAGLLIGGISALLGIGGGTMTVPYLIGRQLAMKNAVATSSACTLPIACSAAASYVLLGWQDNSLPFGSLGYIYLPAFLGIVLSSVWTAPQGAKLAHRLPAQQLKRYFAIVLFFIGLKMLWQALELVE